MNSPENILNQISRLLQNKDFASALTLCREHWKTCGNNPQFKLAYARSVYYLHIKNFSDTPPDIFCKSVNAVFELAPPPNLLAYFALKNLLNYPNSHDVFKLILTHHPAILSSQTLQLILNTHHPNLDPPHAALKNVTLLYSIAKKFHLLNKTEQAHDIAHLVVENFPNNIKDEHNILFWSNRLKILSSFKINPCIRTAEAFKNLIESKKDWFLSYELANMYFQLNDLLSAAQFLFHSCVGIKKIEADVPLRYKVFLMIIQVTEKLNTSRNSNYDLSKLHSVICALFEKAQLKSKFPSDLIVNLPHNTILSDNLSDELKNEILKIANAFNIPLPKEFEPPLLGTVHSWFPDKGFGFIEHNHQTYYFNKIDHLPDKSKITKNASCEFILKNSFDKKKNKPSLKAHILRIINN